MASIVLNFGFQQQKSITEEHSHNLLINHAYVPTIINQFEGHSNKVFVFSTYYISTHQRFRTKKIERT